MSFNENRIHIAQDRDALVITIRAKRHLGICAFLMIWLAAWAAAWMAGVWFLFFGELGFVTVFMLLWLTIWTFGGLAALSSLLWMLKGCEIITITDETLTMNRQMPLRQKYASYNMDQLGNMRVVPGDDDDTDAKQVSWRDLNAGIIKIDHAGETFGLGLALDARDAQKTAETLATVFPTLR